MSAVIIRSGIQASLQAGPRLGFRHRGMPWAGAADPLSMALANWLVENSVAAPVVELTYGGMSLTFERSARLALAGAPCSVVLDGAEKSFWQAMQVRAGQTLEIGAPPAGLRTYLAIGGGWSGDVFLGSVSTYLPAAIGGYAGRALKPGDQLTWIGPATTAPLRVLPEELRTPVSKSWALRATVSAETDWLQPEARQSLFHDSFQVERQSDRMGLRLGGPRLQCDARAEIKSSATFPGLLQCPPDGAPIILMVDSQTTGGYPRIAHIARCDRHLLGQIRPSDRLRLLPCSPDSARKAWQSKQAYFRQWIPDLVLY